MASSQRRQREKESRKKDIINAAETLFFSRGYDNVTMDDIARKVDLNKATLYLYFNDKESLYYAVVLRGVRLLSETVREKAEEEGSGIDRTWRIWLAYTEFAKQRPDHFRAYMYFQSGRFDLDKLINMEIGTNPAVLTLSLLNIPNGELVKDILDAHYVIFDLLRSSIKSGIEEGDIRPEVDPAETAALLLMLAEGAARMNPAIRNELEIHGISHLSFLKNAQSYIHLKRDPDGL